jgi:hypothetical protein
MQNCFISYFDYMGFKEFILNNPSDHLVKRMSHVFRDIENALAKGKLQAPKGGIVLADISESIINSINISDTVIFWTNDTSIESFKELIQVTDRFNYTQVCYNFPVRGVMVYGEVHLVGGTTKSDVGAVYNVSCLYGKGLVNAHMKAEDMSMAGCVVDQSVVEELAKHGDPEDFLRDYTVKYKVPYKHPPNPHPEEYVFGLTKVGEKMNDDFFNNKKKGIEEAFTKDNKGMNKRVEDLLGNTINFLKTFKENKEGA